MLVNLPLMRKLAQLSAGFIHIPIIFVVLAAVGIGVAAITLHERASNTDELVGSEILGVQRSLPKGSASNEEILVGFKSGVDKGRKDNVHRSARAAVKQEIHNIAVDVVQVPEGSGVSEIIEQYRKSSDVAFAEPNFLASAFETPNDPLYGNQWNLKKVMVEESYDVAKGGYGPIAIIDTGVDASHPDLSGLVLSGYNTISENTNSHDDNGHGTHVAGIASAQTNNSSGIASISYAATILPVKVLGADGSGTYSDVSEGITYAADKGVRIINLSLGGSSDSETLKRAVTYAQSKGSVVVAAAGNDATNAPLYPAAYPGVLAVSASDQNDSLASFSNYGSNIFVASPGVNITSSVPGGSYKQHNGTSMAAPHLSGLLALVFAADSSLSNTEAIEKIKDNAEKVGPYAYDANGWNQYFGYGRISSGKTLQSTVEASPSPSLTPTASPSAEPSATKTPKPAQSSFNLKGIVESVDTTAGKVTVTVESGTPVVMSLLVGNLVDVYIDAQTQIKQQNTGLQLHELLKGNSLNVKGKVIQNKLIASEIMVSKSSNSGSEAAMEVRQNSPVNDSSPAQNSTTNGDAPVESNSASHSNGLPEQAQGRGNVRGSTTTNYFSIFWEKLLEAIQ